MSIPSCTFLRSIPTNQVRQIENHPTGSNDLPTERIEIADSGELEPDDPSLAETAVPSHGDKYEDFPDDDDRDVQNPQIALDIAKEIREIANKLFREGQIELALEKYQSEPVFQPLSRRAG